MKRRDADRADSDRNGTVGKFGHDIIVIGASAGGLTPLQRILHDLPPGLPAALFIVQHVGQRSVLAEILARAGALSAGWAESGAPIRRCTVTVAPPGRHLLLHESHILLRRGPHENLLRPAIDPLFRSAAASFGGRVIGVVLSGALNDGTAGLKAITRCGGLAIVQDPADAAIADMPRSALHYVEGARCVPAAGIGPLLAELVMVPARPTGPVPRDIRLEAAIAEQELATMQTEDQLGQPSRFMCPECNGTLWEINDSPVLRFRCHVGHAYTGETMAAAQTSRIEETMWKLLRAHQERAALTRRLAENARTPEIATHYARRAEVCQEDTEMVRRFMKAQNLLPDATKISGDDAV